MESGECQLCGQDKDLGFSAGKHEEGKSEMTGITAKSKGGNEVGFASISRTNKSCKGRGWNPGLYEGCKAS